MIKNTILISKKKKKSLFQQIFLQTGMDTKNLMNTSPLSKKSLNIYHKPYFLMIKNKINIIKKIDLLLRALKSKF